MPPQISLTELYSIKNKKELSKHISYDKIIELCHSKIKKIAQAGGMNIFYEVPYIIIGLPLYDINKCVEYVYSSLKKNGLLVQILPYPNNTTLYISWNPADLNIKPMKYLESSTGIGNSGGNSSYGFSGNIGSSSSGMSCMNGMNGMSGMSGMSDGGSCGNGGGSCGSGSGANCKNKFLDLARINR